MNEPDAKEAAPIVRRAMRRLISFVPQRGRPGSEARTAIGSLITSAFFHLRVDSIGPELEICFMYAREAGVTIYQIEDIRRATQQEQTRTVGATLIRDSIILFCLATAAHVIAGMTFVSREDVARIRKAVQSPFLYSEEYAADAMDQAGYRAIVELHAAI